MKKGSLTCDHVLLGSDGTKPAYFSDMKLGVTYTCSKYGYVHHPKQPRGNMVATLLSVLLLASPVIAQQSDPRLQLVSDCIKSVYAECQLARNGHWYYRVGKDWTRDDKVKEAPPQIVEQPCTGNTAQVKPAYTTNPAIHCGDTQANEPRVVVKEPSRFDRQFAFSTLALAATSVFDFTSSRGLYENNSAVANSQGQVSGPKFVAFNTILYGATIAIQTKWPRAGNIIRYSLSAFHFTVGVRNETVKR